LMATATASRLSGPVLSIPSYRSASPTRVKLPAGGATRSPGKSSRRSCMCSPTNHPGSFRCGLHKERKQAAPSCNSKPGSPPSIGSAGSKQTGSALVRLVPMESGHWARRALAPSPAAQQSLQHRRRVGGSRPRPSRLSAVSMAGDRSGDNHQ
uniref:Serine-rich protein n=1 Tax=Aegilops tauschii subsp. strangulata TaxID=200361 RepID=A0A453PXZ3_AEGTS